jgi:hypothetical protein
MKTYIASRIKGEPMVHVHRPDKRRYLLRPSRSLKFINHSLTGFEWGYGGSGPAQLAGAILLDLTGDPEIADLKHQQFKGRFIELASEAGFILTETQIRSRRDSLPNIKV